MGRRYRRSGYRRRSRGGIGGISTMYIAGAALGYFMPQTGMLDTALLAGSVAPFRLGAIKGVAQGYVAGKLIKAFTGGALGGTSTGNNSDVV